VVRGKYDRHRMHDCRLDGPLHGANLSRERFEPAEGAQWFRQGVEPAVGRGTHRFVGRRNGVEPQAAAHRVIAHPLRTGTGLRIENTRQ